MWLFTVLPACMHLFSFWNRKQNLIVALAVVVLGKPWLQWHKGCLQFNANAPKDDVQQSIFITKTQLQVLYLLCSDTNMQLENHKVRACIGRSSAATNQWEPEWSWPVYSEWGSHFYKRAPNIPWKWGSRGPYNIVTMGTRGPQFRRGPVSQDTGIRLHIPLRPPPPAPAFPSPPPPPPLAPASWAHPVHLRPGSKKKNFYTNVWILISLDCYNLGNQIDHHMKDQS